MNGFIKACAVLMALFGVAVLLFHARKTEAASGDNRLEIYYMYNEGEPQQYWIEDLASRFKELHPGLEIDIIYAGREVLGKARPRFIIGNPPDIINQGSDLLEPLMRDDLLEPLEDALATPAFGRDVPWRDTFLPGLIDLYEKNGHRYMVPMSLFCSAFFYDKTLFAQLGLEVPETWDEFLRVCEVLKAAGIEPIAADGTEPGYNVSWYAVLLTRVTTLGRVEATAKNTPGTSWNDQCFLDAARIERDLRDRGFIMKGYEGSKWPSAQMQWAQRKCGLLYCGSWIPKEMRGSVPDDFQIGIFRFPRIEGYPDADYMAQDIGLEAFAVPRAARHKEIAIEFLKFMTTVDAAKGLVEIDTPPAVRDAGMPPSLAGLDVLLAPPYVLTKNMGGITTELSEWYRTVARSMWSDFFVGSRTPEGFVSDLQAAHERYYQKLEALGQEPGS